VLDRIVSRRDRPDGRGDHRCWLRQPPRPSFRHQNRSHRFAACRSVEIGMRQAHGGRYHAHRGGNWPQSGRSRGLSRRSCPAGYPFAIVPVRVADWSKPNGCSVMVGAAQCAGDYLLMMADHLFESDLLTRLLQTGSPTRDVTLAVDPYVDNPLVDPDDATWVKTDERGFITAIGKTITAYDAVDCGAFAQRRSSPPPLAMRSRPANREASLTACRCWPIVAEPPRTA